MSFDVVVPALTLRKTDGTVDFDATRRYAVRAANTWVDLFILSGSTTQGHLLESHQRAAILELWLEVADPSRLLACCWESRDFAHAVDRSLTPMAVLRRNGRREALAFLRDLPEGSTIYSHPMFGGTVFDHALARDARDHDALPAGGKLAKVTGVDVASIRAVTGDAFRLWDGSSRRITASLAAGAAGVVATPLSPFPPAFPTKDAVSVQAAVDPVQEALDALSSRRARTDELLRRASTHGV
ncbi:hypothetical protein [Nocardia terpenica]|uniref:hypothetical protein n=1 Tax=Nocardia terpenica TaxID=455432 RepID=UPI000A9E52FA|nr:hypothetical protein [Nocardia terpenica]NQE87566.1 hypothetical protein [Nocardia terpenica]